MSRPRWLCRWTLSWVSGLDKGQMDCYFKGKEFPIGANMGLRRSVIAECGEFNTALGRSGGNLMGGEEKDLFRRIKAHGGKIIYLHSVIVDHVIPQKRTTTRYVVELAKGVGRSEKEEASMKAHTPAGFFRKSSNGQGHWSCPCSTF